MEYGLGLRSENAQSNSCLGLDNPTEPKFDNFINKFNKSRIADMAVCENDEKPIKRKVEESTQPEFHSESQYYSELELSRTGNENLEKISDSKSQFFVDDDVERDLKHFAKKAMKNIWG